MRSLTLEDVFGAMEQKGFVPLIDRIIDDLRRYSKICIFGMGHFGVSILAKLKTELKDKIYCVSDNDESKHNKTFEGIYVYRPAD